MRAVYFFTPKRILVLICLVAFMLMMGASFGDSAIMDELAHIPAGYGYARYLDYRLNPEHPPLLKALSAVPLLFANVHFPTDKPAWTTDINGQWIAGTQFLYESGNDSEAIVRLSRLAPMLLTILFIVLIWVWSRELMGPRWALVPAALFALSPHVLAHGHYVTTDIAAAFGILLATWTFLKFLYTPGKKTIVWAGLAFGVAQLLKFSAVLLIPYFVALVILFLLVRWFSRRNSIKNLPAHPWSFWRYVGGTLGVFIVGTALIWAVYGLFTLGYPIERQVSDTKFTLESYKGGPAPAGERCELSRCPADAVIWMSGNPVTRPLAQYALGVLMVEQRAAGGNTSFFLGSVASVGSAWYFPMVYLLKEPLPVLAIIFIAILAAIASAMRKVEHGQLRRQLAAYFSSRFTQIALLLFVVFYWWYSIRSPLNIGMRHLMPAIPFMYILAASAWRNWSAPLLSQVGTKLQRVFHNFRAVFASALKVGLLGLLLVWLLIETLTSAPYFLSYFNEAGGTVVNGYRHVTDSNYDWGQDLLRLKAWADEHPEAQLIAVDYFGGGSPFHTLGTRAVAWQSSKGSPLESRNPADAGIDYLAVSVNTLQNAIQPTTKGFTRAPSDEYRWLTALRPPKPGTGNVPEPDYKAGTSIFIYKLR